MNTTITNTNDLNFDYCEWTKTNPNKEEFLKVWQQFTEKEKAAVLADFKQWLLQTK